VHIATRLSLIAGATVPLLYFGSQALAAPFFPGFSILTHSASQLGSDLSSKPWLLNAGAALTGAAALAAAYGLFRGLRSQGVWLVVTVLIVVCSVSMGLASIWAASHPMPDPRHNPGALGAGMFAAPFLVFIASLALPRATGLKRYLLANCLVFFFVAALFSGLIPIDLRSYGGAVQRLGAVVMLVPIAVLCIWLLRTAPSNQLPERNRGE
jgi:hypothetical membrane protein